MSERFKPPVPQGEPFRGDPSDPVPFLTEGQPLVPAAEVDTDVMTPWMDEPAAAPGPPSFTPDAAPPLQDATLRPQFRHPPAGPPLDPAAAAVKKNAKIALALGIGSLLITPLFGPVAIGMGISAIRQGERKIGAWALSTGAAGTLIGAVVAVLVLTGVIDPDQILKNLQNK